MNIKIIINIINKENVASLSKMLTKEKTADKNHTPLIQN